MKRLISILVGLCCTGSAFAASKEGQASNATAAATFLCDSGLWLGHVLRVPAVAPNH